MAGTEGVLASDSLLVVCAPCQDVFRLARATAKGPIASSRTTGGGLISGSWRPISGSTERLGRWVSDGDGHGDSHGDDG